MGYLDYGHGREELSLGQQALPNSSEAFLFAAYIDRRQGRWEDSMRNFEHASQLGPRNAAVLHQLSLSYENLRRYSDASAVVDRALATVPNDVTLGTLRAVLALRW